MADDGRALEDPASAIADTRRELDDLKGTVLARLYLRPTGSIEQTLRTTPAPGTLLLQGQEVSRTDYAALWQWVQDQALTPSVFGAGDGATTFRLPDARGRFLINGGTLAPNTYAPGATGGEASHTLTTAEIPGHTHPATSSAGGHDHGGTNNAGSHTGHGAGGTVLVPDGTFYGVLPGNPQNAGDHSHPIDTDGAHTHTVPANTGGGGAHENRPPYLAVGGLLIWT